MKLPPALVDVIMLLLVVFIFTAKADVANQEQPPTPEIALDPPAPKAAASAPARDYLVVVVTVEAGKVGFRVADSMAPSIEDAIRELRRLGGARPVLIRADPQTPYGPVFELIAAAAREGVDISVDLRPEES